MVKNNTDAAGNSYGSHENFLIRRTLDFNRLTTVLLPFLVSRQLLVGAGAIIPRRSSFAPDEEADRSEMMFGLSARSDVMCEGLSSATTRSRPIIAAGHAPHPDEWKYRWLPVYHDHCTMSPATQARNVTSHALLLQPVEQGDGFPANALHHPVRDIRLVAHDRPGRVVLDRTDGPTTT